jgi:hypothetical protein
VEQVSPEAGREDSGRKDSSSWWQDNSAVVIALLSVVVVAIRLLGVSRGDPQIAYAILQSGGTGNVLIGTLVSTVGLLAIPASAVFAVFWNDAYRASKKIRSEPNSLFRGHILLAAATLGATYIAIYTAPIGVLIISLGLAISAAFIWAVGTAVRLCRKKTIWKWDSLAVKKALEYCICAYILLIVGYEVASPTPWLPIQNFSVAGQGEFSGYMLSQVDGETFILTFNPDEVISVPSLRIRATTQCTSHHYIEEQATVVFLFYGVSSK